MKYIVENFEILRGILITSDENFYLLDGQHKLEAAKRMKPKYIDVVVQNIKLLEMGNENRKVKFKNVVL